MYLFNLGWVLVLLPATMEDDFGLGADSASGEAPSDHTAVPVVLASRRWRGGQDSAVAESRRDNQLILRVDGV